MPVSEPDIVEILETMEERLSDLLAEEIVLPSRENYDDGEVAVPETPKDKQIVITIGDCTRVDDLDLPGNPPRECWEVDYKIRLRLMPSETDPEPIDKKLIRFVRDVRRAMTGGATYDAEWHTFNGQAIDAMWGTTMQRLINDGTSQSDGYVLSMLVRIRVTPGAL
jgi:hypothetical protein